MLDSAFCGAGINIPPVIVEMKNLVKDLKGLLGEFRGWPTVELFSVRLAGLSAEDRERHLLGFCKLAFGHYEELPMGYRRLVDGYLDGERGENLMVWYLTRHTPWKNARYAYIQSLNLENLVIATPDVGGSKRASTYAKYLNCPMVLCDKKREKANVVASMQIIGNVKDANVILVDDMVDTAGTITKAADLMKENGAKSVRAIASHGVMSGPASERVQDSSLIEMVFTDSIPYSKRCDKVKQLSIADLIAETIRRVETNESISSQYLV